MVNLIRILVIMIMEIKERSNLMRLRHSRGFNENVVELLLALGELDNLLDQVTLESAADATILHTNHRLVTLNQRGVVNQTLVDVELRHVIDNDGTLEVLLLMLGFEDVLQQGRLAGAEEATE